MIHNASKYLRLVKTFDHLCWGDWTPGGWEPPAAIEPGATGGLQAESGGPVTGTEGYVKYDVISPDRRHGMIYVYWDNPIYGVTKFTVLKAADDVPPDCDYDQPQDGSSFSDLTPVDFTLVKTGFRHTDGGGTITDTNDLVNVVTGPGSLIGLLGIYKDPELDFEVGADDEKQDFAPQAPTSMKLLLDATPTQWVGDWGQALVRVQVSSQGLNRLTATIADNSSNPPLSTTITFSIGPDPKMGHVVNQDLIDGLIHVSSPDETHNALFETAARTILAQSATSQEKQAIATRFTSVATSLQREQQGAGGAVDQPSAQRMGRALADLIADSRAVVYLAGGIVLELYGVFEGNRQVRKRLHLQRMAADGTPVTDVMLDEHYDIR